MVPCGLDGVQMTSVQKETGKTHDMEQIKSRTERAADPPCRSCVLARRPRGWRAGTLALRGGTSHEFTAGKLPPWLKRPWPAGHSFQHTHDTLASLGLETICTNANCPNRGECWGRGTATVLILGNVCTRNCGFCSVATGKPQPPDPTEPARLADMARRMNIKYLVITSVNRDDLPDGGAGHFRDCINEVRRQCPAMRFEILTPDFKDCQEQALDILRDALPFVFAHNVETVPSLYPVARAGGNYERSLRLLRMAKDRYADVQTKSSIMLGLGEKR